MPKFQVSILFEQIVKFQSITLFHHHLFFGTHFVKHSACKQLYSIWNRKSRNIFVLLNYSLPFWYLVLSITLTHLSQFIFINNVFSLELQIPYLVLCLFTYLSLKIKFWQRAFSAVLCILSFGICAVYTHFNPDCIGWNKPFTFAILSSNFEFLSVWF